MGGRNVCVRPGTQANNIREAFNRTHREFQCYAGSSEERGKDPWFFREVGIKEDKQSEAWPERTRWGQRSEIKQNP